MNTPGSAAGDLALSAADRASVPAGRPGGGIGGAAQVYTENNWGTHEARIGGRGGNACTR